MKTITATLAALLLAGASSAALAQDRDHDRGDHPQGQARAPGPQAGHVRPGAPAGPAAAPPAAAAPAGRGFERGQGPGPGPGANPGAGRQFDHQRGPREVTPPSGDRGPGDRGIGRGPGDRGPDRSPDRGPDRGFDGRHDFRDGGPRADARDGFRGGDRRDDHRDDRRGDRWDDHRDGRNPWRGGERWQPGHAPPVFWSQDRFRIGAYRAPYGYYVRTWGYGDILPRGWYGQDYWLGDFLAYDLPYPPPGYEWVRVGGDALMIDRYSGRIVQVVRGIFW